MEFIVFDTQEEWDAYEAKAYAEWMKNHTDKDYVCTGWAPKWQRSTDDKFIAPKCPSVTDHTVYVKEEYVKEWVPKPAEVSIIKVIKEP